MKITYLGSFQLTWPPNYVQILGLQQNKADLKVYHYPSSGISPFKLLKNKFWMKDLKLKTQLEESDIIILGYYAHLDIPIVKLLLENKNKIFFNQALSEYEAFVEDRQTYTPWSPQAKYFRFLDQIPKFLNIQSIFDTNEHRKYFISEYNFTPTRSHVIPVGADDNFFDPKKVTSSSNNHNIEKTIVLFFGTYIPLHGVEKILFAAKLIEKRIDYVRFVMVGEGQTFPIAKSISRKLRLKNVFFIRTLQKKQLREMIAKSDICLGIFGKTEKAKRVVPQKIYQSVSMAKPIVTMDSPAIQEFFHDGIDCILTQNNPKDIAKNIEFLVKNPDKRIQIGRNAKILFDKEYSSKMIGKKLLNLFANFL